MQLQKRNEIFLLKTLFNTQSLKMYTKADQLLLVTSFGVTKVKENLKNFKREQGKKGFLMSIWRCVILSDEALWDSKALII